MTDKEFWQEVVLQRMQNVPSESLEQVLKFANGCVYGNVPKKQMAIEAYGYVFKYPVGPFDILEEDVLNVGMSWILFDKKANKKWVFPYKFSGLIQCISACINFN